MDVFVKRLNVILCLHKYYIVFIKKNADGTLIFHVVLIYKKKYNTNLDYKYVSFFYLFHYCYHSAKRFVRISVMGGLDFKYKSKRGQQSGRGVLIYIDLLGFVDK